jgi:hypothetical protein
MPSKVSRKPNSDDANDKKLEKKHLEKVEARSEKSIFFHAVTLNKKWKIQMDKNQETLMEEDFVTMAFVEALVKELKMSGDMRGYVDVSVGDYKPSHLQCHVLPAWIVIQRLSCKYDWNVGLDP